MAQFDVVIIGAGPAGLTAGIYAARGGLNVAIVEKLTVGGQAAKTPDIENYPGIEKISGFDLTYAMMKQCQDFGVEFLFDTISKLDLESDAKTITLSSGDIISAKTAIVTVGASPKKLEVDNEDFFIGAGVSYCATCDGAFFKNKPVAVIGGGNTAVEDALYLEKFASEVFLIHRRDSLRASKVLADKLQNSTVKPVWNSVVNKLIGNDKITQIELKNVKNGNLSTISVNGVFVAVGQSPSSIGFEKLARTEHGYIVTDENMHTNIDGVFAAGDVREKQLRQVVTACADGAIAADSAIKYLNEKA